MGILQKNVDLKESGLTWLGSIPKNWQIKRGKTLFRCVDQRSPTGSEQLLTVSSKLGVIPRSSANVTMFKAESYVGYKLCWPDDLVINSLWAWACGLGVSKYHGIISSAYGVYRLLDTKQVNIQYINQLVRSRPFHWELFVRSKGIWTSRLQLTDEAFLSAPFPLPPIKEQEAIVRFLNHLDHKVRKYINARRSLISLLKVQKQAIIDHAVMRGLDSDFQLKESGNKFLLKMPAHWKIRRLRFCTKLIVSNVDKISIEGESPVRLCNYVDVYKNEAIEDSIDFMRATATRSEIKDYAIKIGDVIITKDSEMWNDIGVPSIVKYEADDLVCGYHLAILRPDQSIVSGEYLLRLMQSKGVSIQLQLSANGVTRYGISHGAIKNVVLPIPPVDEQRKIVDYLNRALQPFSKDIAIYNSQIEKIQEIKIALASAVVTGKLDVRSAVFELEQEIDEKDSSFESEDVIDQTEESEPEGAIA